MTAEKRRPRAELRSQADTKLPETARGAIALAGLKTRHYSLRAWEAGLAGHTALAAIGKSESTQRGTVLGAIGGHGSLQKERLDFGFIGEESRGGETHF